MSNAVEVRILEKKYGIDKNYCSVIETKILRKIKLNFLLNII